MIIRFTPEADTELAEAREWYAHQREDLDLEFMKSIDDALSRIVTDEDFMDKIIFSSVFDDEQSNHLHYYSGSAEIEAAQTLGTSAEDLINR